MTIDLHTADILEVMQEGKYTYIPFKAQGQCNATIFRDFIHTHFTLYHQFSVTQ